MKKYIVLSIFSLLSLSVNVAADFGKTAEAAVTFGVLSANGLDMRTAIRGLRHAHYYSSNRAEDPFGRANGVDYVVYPIVDTLVGQGMSKLNNTEFVHEWSKDISRFNRNFVAENVQLITSSAIVRAIHLDSKKGMYNISCKDVKKFGKDATVQVGCDAINTFIVTPAVKSLVEDQNSWTAFGLNMVGNYIISSIIIDNINGRH